MCNALRCLAQQLKVSLAGVAPAQQLSVVLAFKHELLPARMVGQGLKPCVKYAGPALCCHVAMFLTFPRAAL
eukprot:3331362-Amphidinium_carterae.1